MRWWLKWYHLLQLRRQLNGILRLLRILRGDVKWLRVSCCACPSIEVGCRRASLTAKVASNGRGSLPSH